MNKITQTWWNEMPEAYRRDFIKRAAENSWFDDLKTQGSNVVSGVKEHVGNFWKGLDPNTQKLLKSLGVGAGVGAGIYGAHKLLGGKGGLGTAATMTGGAAAASALLPTLLKYLESRKAGKPGVSEAPVATTQVDKPALDPSRVQALKGLADMGPQEQLRRILPGMQFTSPALERTSIELQNLGKK